MQVTQRVTEMIQAAKRAAPRPIDIEVTLGLAAWRKMRREIDLLTTRVAYNADAPPQMIEDPIMYHGAAMRIVGTDFDIWLTTRERYASAAHDAK